MCFCEKIMKCIKTTLFLYSKLRDMKNDNEWGKKCD